MAVKTEPAGLGSVLKWEQDGTYSRDKVVVASGENLALGTVVGRITASDKIVACDQAAVDGSEVAVGFLIAAYDASAADVDGVIIARDAEVVASGLVWPASVTDQAAALAELKAAGIIVREEQ